MSSTEVQIPGGFTPWPGGECPVDPNATVEVFLACCKTTIMLGGEINWIRYGHRHDIIAYRVLVPQPQSTKQFNWSFGLAIGALKAGQRVARTGWNGKGMWLALVSGENWGIGGHAPYDTPDAPHITHAPFIGMKTADNKFVPWLASQTDVLADDWGVVE